MTIYEKLSTLTKALQKYNPKLLDNLQEPLSKHRIDEVGEKLNIKLAQSIYDLFEWKNGVYLPEEYYLGSAWLFPLGGFFPIENSIERYEYYAGNDGYWSPTMFLVFESGGGEMYLLECDENSPQFGMIYMHSIGDFSFDVIISAYDSLDSLISTIIECYEQGCYRLVGNSIQSDYELEKSISKKYNPKSEIWKI